MVKSGEWFICRLHDLENRNHLLISTWPIASTHLREMANAIKFEQLFLIGSRIVILIYTKIQIQKNKILVYMYGQMTRNKGEGWGPGKPYPSYGVKIWATAACGRSH